jgi:hypothetical protein
MRRALSLWILFILGALTMNSQVKVWEGTMPLAASDEGPPDENPNFNTFAQVEDYPYTMRTDIRPTETVHPWHALYLENEYLKCTILPQIGGHISTCIDKLNVRGRSLVTNFDFNVCHLMRFEQSSFTILVLPNRP